MIPHYKERHYDTRYRKSIYQLCITSTTANSKMDSTISTMTISSAPMNNFQTVLETPTTKQQLDEDKQEHKLQQQLQQHQNHQNEEHKYAQSNSSQSGNSYRTLEQYRMQLYNYALNIERFRCPTYTTAAAMAAAEAFVNTNNTTTLNNNNIKSTNNNGDNVVTSSKCTSDTKDTVRIVADNQVGSEVRSSETSSISGGVRNIDASMYGPTTTAALVAAAAAVAASGYIPNHNSTPHTNLRYHQQEQLHQHLAYSGHMFPRNTHSMALSMSLFPARNIFQPEEPKPQHSYIGLIAMAILSSSESKLVLSDIYQYILDNYAYFRTRGPGWRNSIRHNLSLNDCFVKSGRSANGKGHYWAIHPANMDDFRKGDFRRRKAQRKVRKHMGLSVDDGGTDSPSPPPLDMSPPPSSVASALVQPIAEHPFSAAHHLAAAAAFGYLQHHQHHHRLNAYQQHLQQHPHQYLTNSPFINGVPRYSAGLANCQQQQHHPSIARSHLSSSHCDNSHPYAISHQEFLQNKSTYPITEPPVKMGTSTRTTRTKIANLYSKTTRKRQFDVASLLAPDEKYDDDSIVNIEDKVSNDNINDDDSEIQQDVANSNLKGGKECCQTITIIDNVEDVEAELADTITTTTTEHTTVITKLSVQHQYQFLHQYRKKNKPHLPNGKQIVAKGSEHQDQFNGIDIDEHEDIDVVASDIDNDDFLTNTDNDRSQESCEQMIHLTDHKENNHDTYRANDVATTLSVINDDMGSSNYIDIESTTYNRHRPIANSIKTNVPVEISMASVDKNTCRKLNFLDSQTMPMTKVLGHQQHDVDEQILSRYYGTYMTATRQIGNTIDMVLPKNAPHQQ